MLISMTIGTHNTLASRSSWCEKASLLCAFTATCFHVVCMLRWGFVGLIAICLTTHKYLRKSFYQCTNQTAPLNFLVSKDVPSANIMDTK